MSTVKERYARHDEDDIIELGNQAEALMKTDFWVLLEETVANEKSLILSLPHKDKSSDEVLGELRGLQRMLDAIQCLAIDMNRLVGIKKKIAKNKKKPETSEAREPNPDD